MTINWLEKLGWTQEHIEDLRFTGFSYIRQGKYDIALPFFEALNVLDPDSAYDAQTLGALYLELNLPDKAILFFEKALMMNTEHSPTLLNLCKCFLLVGRIEDARKLAQILKNDPNPYISNTAKALLLAYG